MIDLSTWNLSIPVGSPAKTIETPVLAKGYKDQYFHADSGTLFFWAPVTGTTTKSAKYPRSELRETNSDGSLRNWKYTAADNYLRASLTINQVPSTGKVVIGQIHQYDSSEPLVKLEYQYKTSSKTGNLVIKVRTSPSQDESTVIQLASGVKLNTAFDYTIHLDKAGTLTLDAAGYHWSKKLSSDWKTKNLYFKAGMYVQDNSGYTSEGGKATFTKLEISHAK
jgi:hypothetical protein